MSGTMKYTETTGTVSLRGDLTVDTVSRLFRAMPAFTENERTLDLSAVENADSAGLALLVYWVQEASRHHCRLRTCHIPAQVLSLIRLQGLTDCLTSHLSGDDGRA